MFDSFFRQIYPSLTGASKKDCHSANHFCKKVSSLPNFAENKVYQMTELTTKQKKEWARTLFLDGTQMFTQQEIADKVGVSRKTINKWITDEKWGELRISLTMTKDQSIKRLHQQLDDLLYLISTRPMGERHATPPESETINKLSSAIEKLETEVGVKEVVNVSVRVIEFVRKYDVDKAKEIADIFDQFIKSLL